MTAFPFVILTRIGRLHLGHRIAGFADLRHKR
jgi:hypothetical protein